MARDTQIEAPTTLAGLLGEREDMFGQLVYAARALIQEARDLRAADKVISREFIRSAVDPWSTAVQSKHDALRLLLISRASDLRAAAELASRGEAATAVEQYGDLLRSVGTLVVDVDRLRRARPTGPSMVSLQLLAHLNPRPQNEVQEILSIVIPPNSEHEMASELIADVTSRLGLEGLAAELLGDIQRQPALARLLAQEPVTA